MTPDHNQNVSQLCDPTVDAAGDAALAEPDPAKAAADWAAVQARILRNDPLIPTVYGRRVTLRGSAVRNAFPALAYGGAVDLGLVAVR